MDISLIFFILMLLGQSCLNVVVECPSGEYWEELFSRCEKCNTLCEQARMRGNLKACEDACPGYLEKIERSSTGRPMSPFIPTTIIPNNMTSKTSDNAVNIGIETWEAPWIAVVALLCVIVIVWLMVVYMKKRGKERHSILYNHGRICVAEYKPPVGDQDTGPPVGDQDTGPPAGVQDTEPPAGVQDTGPLAGVQDTEPPAGVQDTGPLAGVQDTEPPPSVHPDQEPFLTLTKIS